MVPCTPPGCCACSQGVLVDSSPQTSSSVVHAGSLEHMPAAVHIFQVLSLMSSDLCEAEGDHQHPKRANLCCRCQSPGSRAHRQGWGPCGAMPGDPGLSCAVFIQPLWQRHVLDCEKEKSHCKVITWLNMCNF